MDYKKDYYKILDVDSKVTAEGLRASYRHLAKLHHPDKNPGDPASEERFKVINEAYEILSNEITRHIYDSYREKAAGHGDGAGRDKAADEGAGHDEGMGRDKATGRDEAFAHRKASQTKKTRTYTVKREKRVYVHGTIEVKFQGEPELSDVYARQWEQRFTIFPTEVRVTVLSSEVFTGPPPEAYLQGYSTVDLFTTPLQQPVNCKVVSRDNEAHYQLDLYDMRVKDPVLKDITRHEQYSFGTLYGKVLAYVLHLYEEEVTEEYTEYSGATGHVETKAESGHVFSRQQFYAKDGGTYWGEWNRSPTRTGTYQTRHTDAGPSVVLKKEDPWSDWWWVIVLIVLIVIYPPLLFVILSIMAVALIFFLLGWIVSAFDKAFPWLGAIIIGLIIVFAVRSLFYVPGAVASSHSGRKYDSVSSKRSVVQGRNNKVDTMVIHHLRWEDRDSARYDIQLSMPLSAIYASAAVHEQMDEEQYALQGIGLVYRHLLDADSSHTRSIAAAFDSLARSRSLGRLQKASMVMSCIQSIPYSIIVDQSCSAKYSDEYISQYLSHCKGDCCKGYSKFGVQSPVEFIGDLKGDCDTRALLLFDLLGQLGYKVALMTSNYYKHALIAVNLDKARSENAVAIHIDGKPYYLWETTSKGFGPGELPAALSNLDHWNIALKN